MNSRSNALVYIFVTSFLITTACTPRQQPVLATQPVLADELTLYNWPDYIPQEVIAGFTAEYKIEVQYLTYMSQDQAFDDLHQEGDYDVVIFDNSYIPPLVDEDLIATINFENVTNIKNISANFRDLVFDFENAHSVPFNWGTIGIMVRADYSGNPIANWSDLWTIEAPNKILFWKGSPRETIGLTLKSLGFSANSEDPKELQQAEEMLMTLRPHVVFIDDLSITGDLLGLMQAPQYPVALGFGSFAVLGQQQDPPIDYVLPAEGAILRGDNFVIPSNSPHKATAELFINYILRPEVAAQITNQSMMASTNDAAREYIDPAILTNPIVYPDIDELQNAEIILPLSPAGENLIREIWDRFVNWQS